MGSQKSKTCPNCGIHTYADICPVCGWSREHNCFESEIPTEVEPVA